MRVERAILLLVPLEWSYGRCILRGIYQYAKPAKPWALSNPKKSADRPAKYEFFRESGIQGIIALTDHDAIAALAEEDDIPVVWIEQMPHRGLREHEAMVGVEISAIADLSVKHFVERGYRSFGVFGGMSPHYAWPRLPVLARAVAEAGFEPSVFDRDREYEPIAPTYPHVTTGWEQAHQWLASLPKPAAVLTADDRAALVCTEICRRTDIPVPEQVAVLGVGDDDMYCEMAYPPLSSVQVPGERLGYLAANLLERLMDGATLNSHEVCLPPSGVIARRSTDTVAIDDAEVAQALRFIRDHAHEPIGVCDVVRAVPLSRRVLEQRFQKLVGRGPYAEIQRQRINHVRQMLAETDLTLDHVAEHCGYNSVNRMSLAFRQAEGVSPGAYRKRFRPAHFNGQNGDPPFLA